MSKVLNIAGVEAEVEPETSWMYANHWIAEFGLSSCFLSTLFQFLAKHNFESGNELAENVNCRVGLQ